MADIPGTSNNDVLQGTEEDDLIQGFGGQDTISGEGGDDSIEGGDGDDVLFGDSGGSGTAPGNDASPLRLEFANARDETYSGNNAQPGDSVIYDNIATLEDGTPISGRLVLVSTSDPDLPIDMAGRSGAEILLNGERRSDDRVDAGETATFRMEFFNPETGEPVSLNSTATFGDLDRNGPGDNESVTLDADSFSAFGTASDTSLEISEGPGFVTATGSEQNNPDDQDAWFSAQFEDRTFIEFTLETRSTQSGFTFNGDLIDDPVVEPIMPGNDTIDGGAGQDVIFGQGGDDSLAGGEGDDELYGGEGEDTLIADSGQDSLFGGTGNDTILIDPVSNIGVVTVVGGEDPDDSDIDTLDLLAGVQNGDYADFNIIDNDSNPEDGLVELLDDNGNIIGRINYSEIENIVICFTPGTLIATPKGERAVESLTAGDRVFTRDNGIQEIRWIGHKTLSAAELLAQPELRPVTVKAGSLGAGLPERDLTLSPNHRLLLAGADTSLMFEESEVLASAKHLVGRDGISQVTAPGTTYIHMMFDHHEVVLSNGAWTESFQPGDYSLKGLGSEQRQEILSLFPELSDQAGLNSYESARRVLKKHEARLLAS